MSSKRPSLAESMRLVAEIRETIPGPGPMPAAKPSAMSNAAETAASAAGRRSFFAASRVGKVKVTTLLEPADKKQLNFLALELEKTNESLIAEAISDLFQKYGKRPIGQGKNAG